MDSRIRELEQWLAEAKRDLGESGQEAYLRKLYLLDAEIRAVIKASGAKPDAVSPQRKVWLVRGQARSTQGTGGSRGMALTLSVGGVALLAAAAVAVGLPLRDSGSSLLARLSGGVRNYYMANSGRGAAGLSRGVDGPSSTTPPVGFIPAFVPGEEVLPAGWTPVPDEAASAVLATGQQREHTGTSLLAGAEQPKGPAPARTGGLPQHSAAGIGSYQPEAPRGGMIMASLPPSAPAVHAPAATGSSGPTHYSSFGDANEATDVTFAGLPARKATQRNMASAPQTHSDVLKPPQQLDRLLSQHGGSAADSVLHGEVPISSGGGLEEKMIGKWNFNEKGFGFPSDYKVVPDNQLKFQLKLKATKGGRNKTADGAAGDSRGKNRDVEVVIDDDSDSQLKSKGSRETES